MIHKIKERTSRKTDWWFQKIIIDWGTNAKRKEDLGLKRITVRAENDGKEETLIVELRKTQKD